MKEAHRVLIAAESAMDVRLTGHKNIAKQLYRTSDVHGVSPVFQFRSPEQEGLSVCYSLRTLLEVEEMFERILEIEGRISEKEVSLYLLLFDDYIVRKPSLNLPWPDLCQYKKWSVPASYLWPNYIHPIEEKSLSEISEGLLTEETVSFYTQSKSLLDFLNLEI